MTPPPFISFIKKQEKWFGLASLNLFIIVSHLPLSSCINAAAFLILGLPLQVIFLIFPDQQFRSRHEEPDVRAEAADCRRVCGGHDQPQRPCQEVELQCRHHQDLGQEGRLDLAEAVQEVHLSGLKGCAS